MPPDVRTPAPFAALLCLVGALGACQPEGFAGDPLPDAPWLDERRLDRAALEWLPLDGAGDLELSGVWGSGPDDVWLVGRDPARGAYGGGVALHWDGRVMNRIDPAVTGDASWDSMRAVAGLGADDVWIAGASAFALRDGAWTRFREPECTYSVVTSLWVDGPEHIWAAGAYGCAWRWDGQRWIDHTPPHGANPFFRGVVHGIYAPRRASAWAVGGHEYTGLIGHWDGFGWHFEDVEHTLYGVWAAAEDDIWAVGREGLILHGDGQRWTVVPSGTAQHLRAVGGLAANAVWAVGDDGTVLLWDGERWGPVESGTGSSLRGVWDGGDVVWVVGASGTVLRLRP